MMKHIRLIIAAFAVFLGLQMFVPVFVSAESAQESVCNAIGSNDNCTSTPHGTVSLNTAITAVINILSIIIGVLAVIMIMVSGYKYITASGDSSKITSAKNTLIYAIIGLIVAALAQMIVHFVLEKLK